MDTKNTLHFVPSELQDGQRDRCGQESPVTFRDHVYDKHVSVAEPDVHGSGLVNTTRKYVKLMNFQEEVRAHRDLDSFLAQASILLDEKAATPVKVLRRMVAHVAEDGHRSCDVDEVMTSLFTDAGGKEFSVQLLSETIQGVTATSTGLRYEPSWLCILSSVRSLQRRHVSVARLDKAQNWGVNCSEARYVILILAPAGTKSTKTATELGRTFSTMFSDVSFRQKLLETKTAEEFKQELVHQRHGLSVAKPVAEDVEGSEPCADKPLKCNDFLKAGRGVYEDLRRRLPLYPSDFTDGTDRSLLKYGTTAVFLYIAVLLPAIAFGSLHDENTRGEIDVRKTIVAQSIGGVIYALFAGSPLVVPLTTAPLAVFISVIRGICDDYGLDFAAFSACIGLWGGLFLVLGGLFNVSLLMKLFKRSTEEVFALFISVAFVGDAVKGTIKIFEHFYHRPTLVSANTTLTLRQIRVILETAENQAPGDAAGHGPPLLLDSLVSGTRERPVLCLLLMLGTWWLGYELYLIKKSPYLTDRIREVVSDCALPISVVTFSFIGSYLFLDIKLPAPSVRDGPVFNFPRLDKLTGMNTLSAAGLGLLLALLIFIDQNIVISLTHVPEHKLLKGTTFHWDLMLTGFINILMSCLGLPWMHAAFPHSSLHARQLAKVEQHVESGHLRTTIKIERQFLRASLRGAVEQQLKNTTATQGPLTDVELFIREAAGIFTILIIRYLLYWTLSCCGPSIVSVRETRVTALAANVLIGLSAFMLPVPLQWIPKPILYGLFLHMAATSLDGNQMVDRMALLLKEQRKLHYFTGLQVTQLIIVCAFGMHPLPYVKMVFPLLLMLLVPVRCSLLPRVIDAKYLDIIDAQHM